jgi:hypothetical protein
MPVSDEDVKPVMSAPELPGVSGRLRVGRFGQSPCGAEPARYVMRVVNGPDYGAMTDNDLRGCLDGTTLWGWNQATQTHVRVGRMSWPGTPMYGELELFRVIQRWDGIELPAQAEVVGCRLELDVEEPPPIPVRLLLYVVKRDWGPGEGGIHRNNVSPPARGEAWWRASRHEIEAWGLPGAGYASDTDPEADTPASPLAQAVCNPDATTLVFEGDALTEYVAERIRRGAPVLLLLKVCDIQEDVPGAFVCFYSGEYGDSRSEARRPRLILAWEGATGSAVIDRVIALEHGRALELPRFPVEPGDRIMASFESEPGYEQPLIEIRTGVADRAGPWKRIGLGLEPDGEWAQVRIRAVENPVGLGEPFTAELTDTWVVSNPAEDQVVRWVFTSPTGAEHALHATYEGGFRWSVRFTPDEPGPWRYRWRQEFFRDPVESTTGRFDVVASTPEALRARLDTLAAEAARARTAADVAEAGRLRIVFSRLERLAMTHESPAGFRSPTGPTLAEPLRRARSALWGKPVPDPIPLRPHPLITEIDGRPLVDPIPDGRAYGLGPERPVPRKRSLGSRLLLVLRRAARAMVARQPVTGEDRSDRGAASPTVEDPPATAAPTVAVARDR